MNWFQRYKLKKKLRKLTLRDECLLRMFPDDLTSNKPLLKMYRDNKKEIQEYQKMLISSDFNLL